MVTDRPHHFSLVFGVPVCTRVSLACALASRTPDLRSLGSRFGPHSLLGLVLDPIRSWVASWTPFFVFCIGCGLLGGFGQFRCVADSLL